MKFRNETRRRTAPRTIEGVTHDVAEAYTVRVPVLPRDLDQLAIRAAAGLVLVLTGIVVVWSTFSIGALLHGGPGYAAAALFDVAWAVTILLEWLARFDPAKRAFARRMGWLLLGVTMGALFWHGLLAGSVALAVVGSAVSFVAKVLWMGIMRHVDRDLSEGDRQWVAAEISKANAKLAIAGVRRQAAAAEVRARLELLAAERDLAELENWTANEAEPEPNTAEAIEQPRATVLPLTGANTAEHGAEQAPSIAELARQQLAAGATPQGAAAEILRRIPTANPDSVQATIRRERRAGGYL